MPVMNRRIAAAALSVVAGAGVTVALLLHRFTHRLPTINGRFRLGGLRAPVAVIRDRWGVPHIFAEDDEDLFFAQGFVQAQDRFLQMELQRRAAAGRLSELAGEATLPSDRLMRRLGFWRLAEREAVRLNGEDRRLAEAFARGVNAYLDTQPLPWELRLLGSKPERWSIVDSLAFGRLMAWLLTENWGAELARARIVEEVGAEALAAVDSTYAADHPLVVPPAKPAGPAVTSLLAQLYEAQRWLGQPIGGASNSWALAGTRTASGRPLLASDPHLVMQVPAIWYEMSLQSPGFHVVGATLPGIPGVMIGHNERIAWGITAAMVDTADAYLELLDEEGKRYRTPEGWRNLASFEESIFVKGRQEPIIERIAYSRHGPLLTERDHRGYAVALRTTVLSERSAAEALFALNRAQNWSQFREALRKWAAPCLNFIYADVEGNIGYQLAGEAPRRRPGTGLLPAPGWSDEGRWEGFIPFEELPHALNPATGAIVSANNKIVGADYQPDIHGEWLDGYRALRIWDMLGERCDLTVKDCQAIQGDVFSIPGKQVQALVEGLDPSDPVERLALAFFREWDGFLTEKTIGGTVYEAFILQLAHRIVRHRLGPMTDVFFGGSDGVTASSALTYRLVSHLIELLQARDPEWFGGDTEGWQRLLAESFSAGVSDLRRRLGDNVLRWQWGRIHRLTFTHLLGHHKLLGRLLNKGPFPMPGDAHTVLQSAYSVRRPFDASGWTVSYRQVIDLGDWSNCWSITPPGQSGHRFSPHYADLIAPWRRLEYHPMIFDRAAAITHAEAALRLEPPLLFR